jgi:GntR family negative regulator for fad regulon and positive regulator of fabA
MIWSPPPKPAELTESRLIDAILDGSFAIGAALPAERELAAQLGVTRPTLREALQRLARDGWIEIRQGRPTRVRDYWQEGSLGVLGAIARHSNHLPHDFIPNLLYIRFLLAPAYSRLAVTHEPQAVVNLLDRRSELPDVPEAFASFDWLLHHQLTVASRNPVFTLILNGFRELYQPIACQYFQLPESRQSSRVFYTQLSGAASASDPVQAEAVTRRVMAESLELWQASQRHLARQL